MLIENGSKNLVKGFIVVSMVVLLFRYWEPFRYRRNVKKKAVNWFLWLRVAGLNSVPFLDTLKMVHESLFPFLLL